MMMSGSGDVKPIEEKQVKGHIVKLYDVVVGSVYGMSVLNNGYSVVVDEGLVNKAFGSKVEAKAMFDVLDEKMLVQMEKMEALRRRWQAKRDNFALRVNILMNKKLSGK